jgi:Bacteriophage related domain of unknown function
MSAAVYADARARVQAVADAAGINVVAWPNEPPPDRPEPPKTWMAAGFYENGATVIEIGNSLWEERGQVMIDVMVPVGEGIADGLTLRDALKTAFRAAASLPVGLHYGTEESYDQTGAQSEDGVYFRLTMTAAYRYQTRTA